MLSPRRIAALLFTVAAVLLYFFASQTAFVKIQVDTADVANFRIYWQHPGDTNYSDEQSSFIQIHPDKHVYLAPVTNLKNVSKLRVDPTNGTSLFRIKEISLYQNGLQPIRLQGDSLKLLQPNDQVALLSFDRHGLVYQPLSFDSFFEFTPDIIVEPMQHIVTALQLLLVIVLALWLCVVYPSLITDLKFVPNALLVICVLIAIMATISRPHAHPDEHAHLQAAEYFENHSHFPKACADGTLHTYTNYGTSRLNANELAYFIAGKYLKLVDFIPTNDYLKLRFFNVGLFVILALLAFKSVPSRWLFLPLIMTPQLWYLFSYFNSDAFALFISFIIAYQIAVPKSYFHRFAKKAFSFRQLWLIPVVIVLAAFLFIIKKNAYFFSLFLLGFGALHWLWPATKSLRNRYLSLALGFFVLGLCCLAGWHYLQQSQYEQSRKAAVFECRIETAKPAFNPVTPLDQQNWALSFDDRGISFADMLDRGWAKSVFITAFGDYGYVQHPASSYQYELIAALLIILLLYLFYIGFIRGSAKTRLLLSGSLILAIGLISIAAYKSWTVDYQPQGRYFLILLPILGLVLNDMKSRLHPAFVSALFIALFILGVYSFADIGLLEIRKFGT